MARREGNRSDLGDSNRAGHSCLARLVQGTVSKLLGQEEIKPHEMRYYLERRDAGFGQKMAEVLCAYREVQVLKKAAAGTNKSGKRVAIVSYDEKPGIRARDDGAGFAAGAGRPSGIRTRF